MTRMDTSTHTPGPWRWDGKFTVTIPHKDGDTAFRTMPEDARLIAAAPDLLDALRFYYDTYLNSAFNFVDPPDPDHEAAVAKIQAAIAKAEGRS